MEGGDGSEERRRVWWLISALDRGCKLWNNKKLSNVVVRVNHHIIFMNLLHAQEAMKTVVLVGWISYVMELQIF